MIDWSTFRETENSTEDSKGHLSTWIFHILQRSGAERENMYQLIEGIVKNILEIWEAFTSGCFLACKDYPKSTHLSLILHLPNCSQVALLSFTGSIAVKNMPAKAGDEGNASLISGSGRSSGEGHGNPLQYSCLENPKDRGAWQATVQGLQRARHDWKTEHWALLRMNAVTWSINFVHTWLSPQTDNELYLLHLFLMIPS